MNDQVTQIIQRVEELPTLPGISMQIMQMVNNPSTSAYELAKLIEKDPALATKILKTVNSAYYSLSRKIGSIQHAIGFLGFRKLSQLIVTVSVFKDLTVSESAYSMKKFWIHSLLTAECARIVCAMTRKNREDDAYTAGLLHDIGKLFLVKYFPVEMHAALENAGKENMFAIDSELQFIGTEHAYVGALLAQKWRLPDFIVDAIRHHHSTSTDPILPENKDIVNIIAFSDVFIHMMTAQSYPVTGVYEYSESALISLGLSEDSLRVVASSIEAKMVAAEELLHILRE